MPELVGSGMVGNPVLNIFAQAGFQYVACISIVMYLL